MRAIWRGAVLAESETTVTTEGNRYFPPEALRREHLAPSAKRTRCSWKGEAHYFDVVVDGEVNAAAAWTYPAPKPAAEPIRDHVAFWGGVDVIE